MNHDVPFRTKSTHYPHLMRTGASAADDSSMGSVNVESTAENDGDIDEYSDGLTTHDDGGESTEPEHPDRTLFFVQQFDQTPAR